MTAMPIQQLVFYFFSGLLILSGCMVISAKQPVKSVLFLVLAFFAAAALWITLSAEFLGLTLIFVYVGAVMTLFLFVVMMLDVRAQQNKKLKARYLPVAILAVLTIIGILLMALGPHYFGTQAYEIPAEKAADYSNVQMIGAVLYTDYVYAFELAGVLLLVGIVAAISLAFRGAHNRKLDNVAKQVRVEAKDRLEIIKLPGVKKKQKGQAS